MANIKSQKKRIITNEKARLLNVAARSEAKTFLKNAHQAIQEKSDDVQEKISAAQSHLASVAAKNRIHKNTAARRTSKLMKAANANK